MTRVHVFCDFDGTITQTDSLELLLERHARDASWRDLEEEVQAGRLPESEVLGRQFDLVEADESTALATLDREVRVDPWFGPFLAACRADGIGVTILSGGFESLIRRFLAPLGTELPEIRANDYRYDGAWRVSRTPYRSSCPGCNHCKALSLIHRRRTGERVVMVGDGSTDLCAAFEADLVLGRGILEEACRAAGREVVPMESFRDVLPAVRALAAGGPAPGPARENPIRRRYGFAREELRFLEEPR